MAKGRERIAAVIPAYNEEFFITEPLKATLEARRRGFVDDIIVDSASTDDTVRDVYGILGRPDKKKTVKRKDGIVVETLPHGTLLKLPEKRGKTHAVLAAARHLSETDADVMLVEDADLLTQTPEIIGAFTNRMRANPELRMLRGRYKQLELDEPPENARYVPGELTGFRAIRRRVWEQALRGRERPGSKEASYFADDAGFGIEFGLEQIVPEKYKKTVRIPTLLSRERTGGDASAADMDADLKRAEAVFDQRFETAENLNLLRKLRHLRPRNKHVKDKKPAELRGVAERLSEDEVDKIHDALEKAQKPQRKTHRKHKN